MTILMGAGAAVLTALPIISYFTSKSDSSNNNPQSKTKDKLVDDMSTAANNSDFEALKVAVGLATSTVSSNSQEIGKLTKESETLETNTQAEVTLRTKDDKAAGEAVTAAQTPYDDACKAYTETNNRLDELKKITNPTETETAEKTKLESQLTKLEKTMKDTKDTLEKAKEAKEKTAKAKEKADSERDTAEKTTIPANKDKISAANRENMKLKVKIKEYKDLLDKQNSDNKTSKPEEKDKTIPFILTYTGKPSNDKSTKSSISNTATKSEEQQAVKEKKHTTEAY